MDTDDTLHLNIEPGGELRLPLAEDPAQMCQQMLMAVGISMAFGGGLVHVNGWLPGLVLTVLVLPPVEHQAQVSLTQIWPGLYARLSEWIEQPAQPEALNLSFDGAQCLVMSQALACHITPKVFTLRCVHGGWVGGSGGALPGLDPL